MCVQKCNHPILQVVEKAVTKVNTETDGIVHNETEIGTKKVIHN
jgi:hypothetical protein